jgi:hypothetical protein
LELKALTEDNEENKDSALPELVKSSLRSSARESFRSFLLLKQNISAGAAPFRKNEKSYLLEDRAAFSSKSRKHDGSGAGVTRQTQ